MNSIVHVKCIKPYKSSLTLSFPCSVYTDHVVVLNAIINDIYTHCSLSSLEAVDAVLFGHFRLSTAANATFPSSLPYSVDLISSSDSRHSLGALTTQHASMDAQPYLHCIWCASFSIEPEGDTFRYPTINSNANGHRLLARQHCCRCSRKHARRYKTHTPAHLTLFLSPPSPHLHAP